MLNRFRHIVAAVGARRALIVIIAVLAMVLPKPPKQKRGLFRPRPLPTALASLYPVAGRRRLSHLRPPQLPIRGANDSETALGAIRQIARVVRLAGSDSHKRLGITAAQLGVLRALQDVQTISMNELAERTLTNASSASEVVTRLVSQGLVSRTRSARDARSVELSLTDAGRLALANAAGSEDELKTGLERMPPRELQQLSRLLGRLLCSILPQEQQSTPAPSEEPEVAQQPSQSQLSEVV